MIVFMMEWSGPQAELLAGLASGFSAPYVATQKKPSTVRVGPVRVPAVDVTIFEAVGATTPIGFARLAVTREAGQEAGHRIMTCIAPTKVAVQACGTAFAKAAALPASSLTTPTISSTAPTASSSRPWSGVTLQTPAGCKNPEPGMIECPSAQLLWQDAQMGPLNQRIIVATLMQARFGSAAMIGERGCLLGGKSSVCSTVSGTMDDKPTFFIVAVGEIDGRLTSVRCVSAEDAETVPPPCATVLTWLPPGARSR